jgi:glucose/arabinose dehydrogenase
LISGFLAILMLLAILPSSALSQDLGDEWGTAGREEAFYKIVELPIPESIHIEAGSFEALPDGRLAIGTRRGDIFLVEGAYDEHPLPTYKRFASGLDEVLGLAYKDGAFYVTQQTELTRITDANSDGRADRFETLSDVWGFNNYHEFAVGSDFDSEGNLWVALCLSKSYHSYEKFRGWALKITPDGKTIPQCSGIRSPLGVGMNADGVMIYAESQGPWNGSCSLKHLKPGSFMGHPVSFNWYPDAPNMGPVPVVPNTRSRMEIERKRVKQLVPYAVVFPYKKMGRSISGFTVDRTGGKFGPFENQIFIGDYTLSIVMRATMEEVNGVWQGACYPFREGLSTGILNVQFTPKGQLLTGGTNRGWPVRGARNNVLERLDWTGKTPFEIREINATFDGFRLTFTKPVDPKLAADPASYKIQTYTHIYQQGYGSPEVDHTTPKVASAQVAADGLSVRLKIEGLVQGHVHEFDLPKLESNRGEPILHRRAYYTLNEIPKH